MDIQVELPLEQVLARRYLRLKPYFDSFVEQVEQSGINTEDYVVVVKVVKKDEV